MCKAHYKIILFREQRELLKKCASTSMCSKLIAYNKDFFSDMVVDAVMCLDTLLPLNMIGKLLTVANYTSLSCCNLTKLFISSDFL